mgnify:FL=1
MKKLLLINLNQTIGKQVLIERRNETIRWALFGSMCIFLLGFLTWQIYMNYSLGNLIEARNNRIEDIRSKTQALKAEGIDLSKKDIESLYKFENNRIFWTKKIQTLSQITPEDMAITELSFINNRFIISAISPLLPNEKEFKVIDKFINLLENEYEFSKDFTSIKFLNSERDVTKNQEILSFQIEAKFMKKKKNKKRRTT